MESVKLTVFLRVMIGVAIVASMWAQTSPVLAHAQLIKAEPARRAALDKAPAQIRLWFNEEIEGAYTTLTVSGKYKVKFRVLSVDGHVVDSTFNYTVKSKVENK
jgi:methionine-rich copper-binding protein CopC